LFCNIDTAKFAPRASALGSTTETHYTASALCFFSLVLNLAWEVDPFFSHTKKRKIAAAAAVAVVAVAVVVVIVNSGSSSSSSSSSK